MPIFINNQPVKHISYYGNEIKRVVYYGVEIYRSSIPAQSGTWTHAALTDRAWQGVYNVELNGTALAQGHSGAYAYTVNFPIYHSGSNSNAYNVTVWLGLTSDSQTIEVATESFTTSGIFTATVVSPIWLGTSPTIYARIYLWNANYLAIDSGKAFSLVCTDPESEA